MIQLRGLKRDFPGARNNAGAIVGVAGVLGAVLAWAGLGWACVPQPFVYVQPKESGPAGTQVTVHGQDFSPNRAEVRWNSLDGPLLAATDGPSFEVAASIPQAPAGLYTVIVVSRAPSGAIAGVGRASFQVEAPGGAPSAGASPASTAPASRASAPRSSSGLALLVGGLALLLLGASVGFVVARRARRGSSHMDDERCDPISA